MRPTWGDSGNATETEGLQIDGYAVDSVKTHLTSGQVDCEAARAASPISSTHGLWLTTPPRPISTNFQSHPFSVTAG